MAPGDPLRVTCAAYVVRPADVWGDMRRALSLVQVIFAVLFACSGGEQDELSEDSEVDEVTLESATEAPRDVSPEPEEPVYDKGQIPACPGSCLATCTKIFPTPPTCSPICCFCNGRIGRLTRSVFNPTVYLCQ